jgi:hypothetical protein
VPIPSRRENNAGRTRTATSDSPPHCRSSLANSRRSNETIRNRDKRYRRSTLENPGRLGRLRWLPFKVRVGASLRTRHAVTIQAGADASPAGFSLKWSILYRRRSRERLRSTRPRALFRGLGFKVALLAPLRRGFLLRRATRPISLQASQASFRTAACGQPCPA